MCLPTTKHLKIWVLRCLGFCVHQNTTLQKRPLTENLSVNKNIPKVSFFGPMFVFQVCWNACIYGAFSSFKASENSGRLKKAFLANMFVFLFCFGFGRFRLRWGPGAEGSHLT